MDAALVLINRCNSLRGRADNGAAPFRFEASESPFDGPPESVPQLRHNSIIKRFQDAAPDGSSAILRIGGRIGTLAYVGRSRSGGMADAPDSKSGSRK